MIATKSHPPPVAAGKPGKRSYLSFSAVSLFQSCPLRHHFRYVVGLPEETISSSLVLGSCIHASVQHHFEQLLAGNAAPDLDTLLDVFQDTWQSYQGKKIQFPKGETRDSLGRLADRMLRSFRASAFARPQGTILGIEEELQGELIAGLPDLLGRLDLIVDTPEALLITDFKTTRSGWSHSHVEEAAPQLLLYSELAKSLAGGKAIRLGFAVLSKAKQPELAFHPVALHPHQMERTKRWSSASGMPCRRARFTPAPRRSTVPAAHTARLAGSGKAEELRLAKLSVIHERKGESMANLQDGQSVEIQGSAAKPYILKNVGGVYSCSCPAWRNQSLPIERRSCKHLRVMARSP